MRRPAPPHNRGNGSLLSVGDLREEYAGHSCSTGDGEPGKAVRRTPPPPGLHLYSRKMHGAGVGGGGVAMMVLFRGEPTRTLSGRVAGPERKEQTRGIMDVMEGDSERSGSCVTGGCEISAVCDIHGCVVHGGRETGGEAGLRGGGPARHPCWQILKHTRGGRKTSETWPPSSGLDGERP